MLVKLTKGISVVHKIVRIVNINNELITVYDKQKGVNLLDNPLQSQWFKYPVEVIVNTPESLIVKQIDVNKIEKLKV